MKGRWKSKTEGYSKDCRRKKTSIRQFYKDNLNFYRKGRFSEEIVGTYRSYGYKGIMGYTVYVYVKWDSIVSIYEYLKSKGFQFCYEDHLHKGASIGLGISGCTYGYSLMKNFYPNKSALKRDIKKHAHLIHIFKIEKSGISVKIDNPEDSYIREYVSNKGLVRSFKPKQCVYRNTKRWFEKDKPKFNLRKEIECY